MATNDFREIIQKISDILTDACPNEWESIEIAAEISNQYSRFTLTSILDGDIDSFILSDQQSMILDDLFRLLQKITKKEEMDYWNETVFIINVNGNFNIDFRYKDGVADY